MFRIPEIIQQTDLDTPLALLPQLWKGISDVVNASTPPGLPVGGSLALHTLCRALGGRLVRL